MSKLDQCIRELKGIQALLRRAVKLMDAAIEEQKNETQMQEMREASASPVQRGAQTLSRKETQG